MCNNFKRIHFAENHKDDKKITGSILVFYLVLHCLQAPKPMMGKGGRGGGGAEGLGDKRGERCLGVKVK
jgi:hypothetical protein